MTASSIGYHNIIFINTCNLALLINKLRTTHKIWHNYKIRSFNEKNGLYYSQRLWICASNFHFNVFEIKKHMHYQLQNKNPGKDFPKKNQPVNVNWLVYNEAESI